MRCLKEKYWVLFILFMGVLVPPAFGANQQSLVFGADIGAPKFSDNYLGELTGYYYGSEFVEWHIMNRFALGLRTHKAYQQTDAISLIMVNVNVTLTWYFLKNAGRFSSALYTGYGPGRISYSDPAKGVDISDAAGDTSSYGLLMDYGGGTWGFRLNYHVVSAEYNDNVSILDGSNRGFGLGFRYAF